MRGRISDKQRLLHIVESITSIESYTERATIEDFLAHSMMRFATIKQLEIIGEATNNISEETQNQYQQILWKQIIGLRHILVHEYFEVDSLVIWQIVHNDLPSLKHGINNILNQFD